MGHDQQPHIENKKRSTDPSGGDEERVRKRRSRWANTTEKAPPVIPATLQAANLTKEQLDLYVIHLRIEEIGRKLRSGDYIPTEKDRSPSPEPIYGADGKRINTKEFRYRKKLEDERHKLVSTATKLDHSYRPPADYRRPTKLTEKIYIPVREFPEINFIGLLLGPRGSTLKDMEAKSKAKIAIRGKGSVKEGKGAPSSYQNQEEDLHCLITADSEDKVNAAIKLVNKVIETASTVPEGQNELKRKQLRDLAALNGTLRDDENQVCNNCGALGHKKWNCPEKQNFTNNIVCRICGGVGHMARDCRDRNNPEAMEKAKVRDKELDSEYQSLMAELGSGGAGQRDRNASAPWQTGSSGSANSSSSSLPPWARPDTGINSVPNNLSSAPWQGDSGQRNPNQHQQTSKADNPNNVPLGTRYPGPSSTSSTTPNLTSNTTGSGAPSSTDPGTAAAYAAYYAQYAQHAQQHGAANPWASYMAAAGTGAAGGSATAASANPYAAYYAAMYQGYGAAAGQGQVSSPQTGNQSSGTMGANTTQ